MNLFSTIVSDGVGQRWATRINRMQKLLTGLLTILCFNAVNKSIAGPVYTPAAPSQFTAAIANEQANQYQQAEQKAEQQREQAEFSAALEARHQRELALENWTPDDPWRIIDGKTNWAKGQNWYQLAGRVVEVQPHGIRVEGVYTDRPGYLTHRLDDYSDKKDFFIRDFPYAVAEGDVIGESMNLTGVANGIYSYPTVLGASKSLHEFVYGKPCGEPQESIDARKAAEAAETAKQNSKIEAAKKAKRDAAARILKWNQDQADAGDPYGLMRMGERYRDGEGVETNMNKAQAYFIRASALGNKQAEDDLEKAP